MQKPQQQRHNGKPPKESGQHRREEFGNTITNTWIYIYILCKPCVNIM